MLFSLIPKVYHAKLLENVYWIVYDKQKHKKTLGSRRSLARSRADQQMASQYTDTARMGAKDRCERHVAEAGLRCFCLSYTIATTCIRVSPPASPQFQDLNPFLHNLILPVLQLPSRKLQFLPDLDMLRTMLLTFSTRNTLGGTARILPECRAL